jgi:Response regulator containing CheY-like receiver, AAA-type ATPase, and DNA-binding domains
MENPEILIIEDDVDLRRDIKNILHRNRFKASESYYNINIHKNIQKKTPDLIILGSSHIAFSDELNIVRKIHKFDRRLPVIMITNHNSEKQAVDAFRLGVKDYFKYTVNKDELVDRIKRCLANGNRRKCAPEKITDTRKSSEAPTMIGKSPVMQEIKTFIGRVGATESNVLITGETGTGKELVANQVYQKSARADRLFVCINCTAIPDNLLESELFGHEKGSFTGADTLKEGRLKQADGGTVFFDEIGDMSLYHQAKILRVIENKEIQRLGGNGNIPLDIRIIAATNQDLEQMVAEGTFRNDLYYRLNVANIHLPPLRERKEDIPDLLKLYISKLNSSNCKNVDGLTRESLESILDYDWPGNIREIKNVLESAFINNFTSRITLDDLPVSFKKRVDDAKCLNVSEKDRLLSALLTTNWNKSQAAKKLSWSRMTLYRKIEKYNLSESTMNA